MIQFFLCAKLFVILVFACSLSKKNIRRIFRLYVPVLSLKVVCDPSKMVSFGIIFKHFLANSSNNRNLQNSAPAAVGVLPSKIQHFKNQYFLHAFSKHFRYSIFSHFLEIWAHILVSFSLHFGSPGVTFGLLFPILFQTLPKDKKIPRK